MLCLNQQSYTSKKEEHDFFSFPPKLWKNQKQNKNKRKTTHFYAARTYYRILTKLKDRVPVLYVQ